MAAVFPPQAAASFQKWMQTLDEGPTSQAGRQHYIGDQGQELEQTQEQGPGQSEGEEEEAVDDLGLESGIREWVEARGSRP